jgi:CRP/FNR family transcriptional regulator, cyclic AMP receptor protein
MTGSLLLAQAQRNPLRRFKKGRSIFFQGEVPRTGYVIKSGFVRAYGISDSGEERTIAYYAAGELLPPGWLFGTMSVSLYYYSAFTDVELLAVTRSDVQGYIANPELQKELLQEYIKLYVGATLHIHALEHSRASEKLLGIFQYLAVRHGRPTERGTVIDLRLTHQDIAGMVGLSRETASIELARLRKKAIISYEGFRYTLDMNRLVQATGSDDFQQLDLDGVNA